LEFIKEKALKPSAGCWQQSRRASMLFLFHNVHTDVFVSFSTFTCSTDNLEFIKEKALKAISRLLAAKPEGEQALLAALVNKLGDPSRKLASDAAYLLGQLLLEHPAMKPVVVREVRFLNNCCVMRCVMLATCWSSCCWSTSNEARGCERGKRNL
jgi:hypothetical protein